MCGIVVLRNYGDVVSGTETVAIAKQLLLDVGNRGNHGAKVIVIDTRRNCVTIFGGLGTVAEALQDPRGIGAAGDLVIAQTRYPTQGGMEETNTQPYEYTIAGEKLFFGHNGNVPDLIDVRAELELLGLTPRNDVDTETIGLRLAANLESNGNQMLPALETLHKRIGPAMNLVMARENGEAWAFRNDALHPFSYGDDKERRIVAGVSETRALLNATGARFNPKEVPPGHALQLRADGPTMHRIGGNPVKQHCSMERIYLANKETVIAGTSVESSRRHWGRDMGKRDKLFLPRDCYVVYVPNTSEPAAEEYVKETGFAFLRHAIWKLPLTDRTFIDDPKKRKEKVKTKFKIDYAALKGKKVVVIEDSVVRYTTFNHIIAELDRAGVEEIHARSCAPPVIGPCPYGIAIGTRDELFAARFPALHDAIKGPLPPELNEMIEAEMRRLSDEERGPGCPPSRLKTMRYLPLENLAAGTGLPAEELCDGCLSNVYAEPLGQAWADKITGRTGLPMA